MRTVSYIQYYWNANNLLFAAKNPLRAFRIFTRRIWKNPADCQDVLFGGTKGELGSLLQEVQKDPLNAELVGKLKVFKNVKGFTSRGKRYIPGNISQLQAHTLYAIIRKLKPEVILETGVCNGYSTAFILLALQKNTKGKLYSIDLPEIEDEKEKTSRFWEGKGGSVIPKGKKPGWVVPEGLKERWELILGKTQNELPPLIENLPFVDIFLHDSEHSYETVTFECNQVWSKLSKGGILLVDDVGRNCAFLDFAASVSREPHYVDKKLGFLIR